MPRFALCVVACLAGAACAHPPRAGAPAQPALTTPGLATGQLPPHLLEPGVPASDEQWRALGREAATLLSQYITINTTNPPGNELLTARWLRSVLARDGIEAQVFEPQPGRADLYARLKGDGSGRPLILLSHMDVVPATPEYWKVDPFGGVVRDGYVWGRGALDMKGEAITQLLTLLTLKRAGVPLKRDVLFVATADEEVGGGLGAGWLVARHPELVSDAEFLLTEGGTIRADRTGRIDYYGVGTTEKSPFWLDLTVRGGTGHASRPTPDNPVHRLVRALYRIANYQTPLVATPATERYLRDLATIEPDPVRRAWLADVRAALRDSTAVRALTADLTYNALLRNTISITRLKGSDKTNVIPPVATAVLDVRLLAGQDPQAFLADLVRVVGDTAVHFAPEGSTWPPTESSTDTELFRAIVAAARARDPKALVTTPTMTGFTDSHFFRNLGIVCYGLSPFPLDETEARGVHGNDERVSLDNLTFGVHFVYDVVARVVTR
jgi:acetylornithine deacetylase/succinyl-diaminopimelate desuccinylase-like protein